MNALKPVQIKAIPLLLAGMTGREVAKAIGCTPETISHWKRDPQFLALMNELKLDFLEAGQQLLRNGLRDAVFNLLELARYSKSEEIRRRACVDVITFIGLSEPRGGAPEWGIGSSDPEEIEQERARQQLLKNWDLA